MQNSAPNQHTSIGTCPICCSDIHPSTPIITCPECHTPHHAICWQDHGGCGRHGCIEAARVLARAHGFATKSRRGKERLSIGEYSDVARFGIRFIAHLLDNLIVLAFGYGISLLLGIDTTPTEQSTAHIHVPLAIILIVGGIYEIGLTTMFGATVGKMALALRIVRDSGEPLDIGHAALRCLVKFALNLVCPFGYLVVAFHPEGKGLQDMAADTQVVRMI